ncbi:hypothetical protein FHX74_001575 [Friedmanniella endophytica]|uniref:HEAT repeat-containing protein n=1 Tax=Microlunatus kandeliicorticis TaxID=1759536 RepID=A0A7W3IRQ0_9ACTN|nr:hypothetical protein [Microlunatus kandeliicorticis]MBA8793970.1 hypothetical protein [Microlunatus kandeliicorticis]
MSPADQYLFDLADEISPNRPQLVPDLDSAGPANLHWNPASSIQAADDADMEVDLQQFDHACQHADPELVARLAWTPGLPEELRGRLAHHAADEVRAWVAAGTRKPELHQLLREDESPRVRAFALWSAFTTSDQLVQAADDRRLEVRAVVADHALTPIDTLLKLAHDSSARVRWSLATGPHAAEPRILQVLQSDPDRSVAMQARSTLENIASGDRAERTLGEPSQ